MTTIPEDPSLPIDLDETSNALSNNSTHVGQYYDSPNDFTSSMSSELEQPGTFRNLTSTGKVSPLRTRTIKDQETQLGEMKKENFGLKLRIYHLEEALRRKYGDTDKGWKLNIELNVQMEDMKKELAEKDRLLMQAKLAMDHMTAQHEAQLKELRNRLCHSPNREQLLALQEKLAQRDRELENALNKAEETNARLIDEEERNKQLEVELQELKKEMARKLAELEQDLVGREIPKATPILRSSAMQTDEDPLLRKLAEMEADQGRQADREKELVDELSKKQRRVGELEMEVLSLTQKIVRMDADHVHRMREVQEELERYKNELYEMEEKLRKTEVELEEMSRKRKAEAQRVRELETQVKQLQSLIHDKDNEIKDLREQVEKLEREAGSGHVGNEEVQELRKKLSEAKAKMREMEAALAAKDRDVKRLLNKLAESEEEVRSLRERLHDLEEALAGSEAQLHQANLDRNKHADILDRLQKELATLREQLNWQQDGSGHHDLDGFLAAKDAIIAQLQRDVDDLRTRLAEADRKYHHLNTSSAAEIGVLQATVSDLLRQLEKLQRSLKEREDNLARLVGEKAGLEREVERLLLEIRELRDQVTFLRMELANQARNLQRAEMDIDELRQLLDRMNDQQPKVSYLDLTALREQLESMEQTLKAKDTELESLLRTLAMKDQGIRELELEVRRLRREKGEMVEKVSLLEHEKTRLEEKLSSLRSECGEHHHILVNFQEKLTRVSAEKEELARKLKLAEEASRRKDRAYQAMYKKLNDELFLLQQQLDDLPEGSHVTVTRHTHTTSTPGEKVYEGGKDSSRNTTMIFGDLSENLLLTILQLLQEVNREVKAGRVDSSASATSLATKLESLRRKLEESMRDGKNTRESPGKPVSSSTNYTTYYCMHGEEGGEIDREAMRSSSTPNLATAGVKKRSSGFSSHKPSNSEGSPTVKALRSELEEMRRWNEALQARLDETQRTRHVGVGMEKEEQGRSEATGAHTRAAMSPGVRDRKYTELMQEVDRLLELLTAEREKSQKERQQQQAEVAAVQTTLEHTKIRVLELEEHLRAAMLQDDGTSNAGKSEEISRLEGEVEESHITVARVSGQCEGAQKNLAEVQRQLDGAYGTIAELRAQLEFERNANKKLKEELANMSMALSTDRSDESIAASCSLPNLLHGGHGQKSTSDSWTTPLPGQYTMSGSKPDVSALKAKNEDMTRLNDELQRKCQDQLLKTPPHSRSPSIGHLSGTSVHFNSQLREQREGPPKEMMDRERELLSQVRAAEQLLLEKEEIWLAKEEGLRREGEKLRENLLEARTENSKVRCIVMDEVEITLKSKDEQILNLSLSLTKAKEKATKLEVWIDQLLSEKNQLIHDLEEKLMCSKQELEVSLTQLASSHELVQALQAELAIYQKLVEDLRRANGHKVTGSQTGSTEDAEEGGLLKETVEKLLLELNVNISSKNTRTDSLSEHLHQASGNERETLFQHSYMITMGGHGDAGGGRDECREKEMRSGQDHTCVKSTRDASTYVCHKTSTSPHAKPTASSSPKNSPRSPHQSRDMKEGECVTSKSSFSNLDSSSSSSLHSRSSSSKVTHEVDGSPGGHGHRKPSSRRSHFSSLALHGFGNFETLENRLQRALDSSTLQAADRTFLEELLVYLRQQRHQLDENRRLLDVLEHEQHQGVGVGTDIHLSRSSPHISAFLGESGTIPSCPGSKVSASPHLPTSTPLPHTKAAFTSKHTSTSTPQTHSQHTRSRTNYKSGIPTLSVTEHGVQDASTHSSTITPTDFPGGVAKAGFVATGRPVTNDYGRRGATSSTMVHMDSRSTRGRTKIDLKSLHDQLLHSYSSLMEAKSSLLQK